MTIQPVHDIIKILLIRNIYNKYYKYILKYINKDTELKPIITSLEALHAVSDADLTLDDVYLEFLSRHQHLGQHQLDTYKMMFDSISGSQASAGQVEKLLESHRKKYVLDEIAVAAYEAAASGDTDKLLTAVNSLEAGVTAQESYEDIKFVTDDLEELVANYVKTPGLRWRLRSLNQALGSLRVGDFGVVAARPETGKTTFLASEVTFMAEQGDSSVLWCNNEEGGSKVKLRICQAALGLPTQRLFVNIGSAKKDYDQLIAGRIKLWDEAVMTKTLVERACELTKPKLIVLDQIDKIKGFDNDRDDLRLGTIYQWARELAKKYAPVIGICQADGTAEGQKWINMGHLANAKTSKQAEADWILGIGRTNDSGFEHVRYFHLSKNKLIGDADTNPTMRHGYWDVLLDADIARYKDTVA